MAFRNHRIHCVAVTLLLVSVVGGVARVVPASEEAAPLFYESDIRDLLEAKCAACHSSDEKESGLDLTTPSAILRGGDSGRILIPGDPKASLLWEKIESKEMPPEEEKPLTANEIQRIRQWIADGAKFREKIATGPEVSQHDIIPLLHLRCVVCHGGRTRQGGLDLRTRASILRGGKSGPACVPGDPDSSLIVQRVHAGEMPPKRELVNVSVKPMPANELEKLARWVELGLPEAPDADDLSTGGSTISAEDRDFWSFQPPRRPATPAVKTASRVRNAIDAFVLRRLEANGLALAPEAEKTTLLRRVYFDLTGLPPTPTEVDRFLADDNPQAYENVVEQLLKSRRYGERWGRHWLDAAGYSDSEGSQNEDRIRHHMYRYRDYVIRSFNADKPYSRFLIEQLAGDELADYRDAQAITPEIHDNLVATGFLRTAPDRTFANITNFVPDRLEVIADEMDILGSALMGLSMKCARCHSHKFDPIPQRDYYRLTAIFKPALDEHDWLKSDGGRSLPYVSTAERQSYEKRIQRIEDQLKQLREQLARATGDAKAKLEQQIQAIENQRPREPRIRALWSRDQPSPSYVLKRGNYQTPGRPVAPGPPGLFENHSSIEPWSRFFATSVAADNLSLVDSSAARTSHRRLAFARWLIQPNHPLTSRVMVNRIWRHHFGRGIVPTVGNFGKAGEPPTHPELLDWLAVEFVSSGWSIKSMHRLIVNSSTYRQSSQAADAAYEIDPDVRLYSRKQPLRLEAESIRDSLLYVAGKLDETPFGPADPVDVRSDGLTTSKSTAKGWRRSIYVLQRRTQIPTLLDSFDFPQMGPNCLERGQSLVAPQALHMMNDQFVYRLAGHFADRVIAGSVDDSNEASLVARAYTHAFSRPPTDDEVHTGEEAIRALRQRWRTEQKDLSEAETMRRALTTYCHALLNLSEFVYVE